MSSYDRRAVLLSLAALAGCGFSPVYGPGGAAEGLRGEIEVDPPVDAAGYDLVQQLELRLGQPQAPRYRLAADIALGEEGLGITTDQEITRYHLNGEVEYRLIEIGTDEQVAGGTVRNFTGYSAPVFAPGELPPALQRSDAIAGNTVSVLSAQDDARERLMTILADQIVARLLATAPEWRR